MFTNAPHIMLNWNLSQKGVPRGPEGRRVDNQATRALGKGQFMRSSGHTVVCNKKMQGEPFDHGARTRFDMATRRCVDLTIQSAQWLGC